MKHYQYHKRWSNLPRLTMAGGLLLLSTPLLAAPGGVTTGLQLWLKADSLSLANGAAISTWGDSAGNPAITTQATPQAGGITYVTNTANFNPGLQFAGVSTNQSLIGAASSNLFNPASTSGTTLISVSAATNSQLGDASATLFTYANTSNGGVGIAYFVSTSRYYSDGSGSLGQPTDIIPNNTYALVTVTYAGGSTTGSLIYLNGVNQTNSPAGVAPVYPSSQFEIGGRTFDGLSSRVFKGIINEVIGYNGQLSVTDRQRVESYLAVKYGLTKAGHYLAADGTTTFWDATANATYQNNVTVIGRDDTNPLSQLKSKSVNPTAIVTLDNGAAFAADKSFLAVGDNAGTTTLDQTDVPGKLRMARVWKVAQTGTVGNVTVTTTGAAGETYLLIDTDGDCNFATGTITKTALTSNSATVTFTNGQCFSLAKESVPAAPSNLTATVTTGATSIDLRWTDNSDNETGFKIESPVGTVINTTVANVVRYSHTGLTCNTTYNYQVMATNAIGDSTAITATATPVCYTLTLQTTGVGTGTVTGAGLYPAGQAITLTATPTNGSIFTGWTPASCLTGMTLSANTTCTATFGVPPVVVTPTPAPPAPPLPPMTLKVLLAGTGTGLITSDLGGIDCSPTTSPCTYTVNTPTWVTLTALPGDGSQLNTWTGDPACTATGQVLILQDTSCTAEFTLQSYQLTANFLGRGRVTGPGIDCPGQCTASYLYGTTVTLKAQATHRWNFSEWRGCDSQGNLQITHDALCQAVFTSDSNIPNAGDGNGDGLPDAYQENVVSLPDKVTGTYLTLETQPATCVISDIYPDLPEAQTIKLDHTKKFLQGMLYFDIACPQAQVSVYYHGMSKLSRNLKFYKFGPKIPGDLTTLAWYQLSNIKYELVTIGGKPVVKGTYTLTDGELGDSTGVDGHIIDPIGLTGVE